jgi:hypothetical protein
MYIIGIKGMTRKKLGGVKKNTLNPSEEVYISIKVNDYFTLNDVALVDKLRYNLFSVSQLLNIDLNVLFCKFGYRMLDSRGDLVCAIFHIGKVFQADFFFLLNPLRSV